MKESTGITDSTMKGLCITTSNSSSLRSYTSSIAESANTSKSNKSLTNKFKNILNRKRSQSLMSLYEPQKQLSSPEMPKLPRNKSISSFAPPSLLSGSQTSTRDNSIASLSDLENDLPQSPLFMIAEDSVEKTGKFTNQGIPQIETVRYTSRKQKLAPSSPTKVADQKLFDDIADGILTKVTQEATIDWRI